MIPEQKTAIIESVKVGRVDHYKDIVLTCSFNMNGTGCSLTFSMEQAKQMMEESGCYDDINSLKGKPCEIEIDDKNTCHFKGMWRK